MHSGLQGRDLTPGIQHETYRAELSAQLTTNDNNSMIEYKTQLAASHQIPPTALMSPSKNNGDSHALCSHCGLDADIYPGTPLYM